MLNYLFLLCYSVGAIVLCSYLDKVLRKYFCFPVQFYGAFELDSFPHDGSEINPSPHSLDNGISGGHSETLIPKHNVSRNSAIVQLELFLPMRLLFVLFSDGQLVSCSVSKKGLKQPEYIKAERRLGLGDAVCASVASEQQILAVGTKRGVVELYDLAESTSLIRSVSLYDWGYVWGFTRA